MMKLTKRYRKSETLILVFIIAILLLVIFIKISLDKYNTNNSMVDIAPTTAPKVNYKKFSLNIPSDWKTYTTNKFMDVDTNFLKKHPTVRTSILSFRYPGVWYVTNLSQSSTIDIMFPLSVQINKTHPKNQRHAWEGLLDDNASISIYFGIVSKDTPDFDHFTWGGGTVHTREEYYLINNIPAIIGYYKSGNSNEKLVEALFKISSNIQIKVRLNFVNTDPSCSSEYCTKTSQEMLQILSSFKFEN